MKNVKKNSFLILVSMITMAISCDKKCDDFDINKEYNGICDILKSDELNVDCGETFSIEGQELGILGKLDPDFSDYLNEYHPDFPDTWPAFFRVLDSSVSEDNYTSTKVLNEKMIQVNLYNDGINSSSFELLKKYLESIFANKAFHTIKIKGITKGIDTQTNTSCKRTLIIEIDEKDDVVIE